jgi:hypothetical protein
MTSLLAGGNKKEAHLTGKTLFARRELVFVFIMLPHVYLTCTSAGDPVAVVVPAMRVVRVPPPLPPVATN